MEFTIDDLLNGQYSRPSLIPEDLIGIHKSMTNNYKIIFIEDIFGNPFDSINNGFRKINEIYSDSIHYYLDKNDAYYSNFFDKKQWRLFKNGFSQLCKFKIEHLTIEVFIDNGKVIGDFTFYFKDKLILKVNFEKMETYENKIIFTYYTENGTIKKIENKNKDQLIEDYKSCYRGGILDLIMSLEYFS